MLSEVQFWELPKRPPSSARLCSVEMCGVRRLVAACRDRLVTLESDWGRFSLEQLPLAGVPEKGEILAIDALSTVVTVDATGTSPAHARRQAEEKTVLAVAYAKRDSNVRNSARVAGTGGSLFDKNLGSSPPVTPINQMGNTFQSSSLFFPATTVASEKTSSVGQGENGEGSEPERSQLYIYCDLTPSAQLSDATDLRNVTKELQQSISLWAVPLCITHARLSKDKSLLMVSNENGDIRFLGQYHTSSAANLSAEGTRIKEEGHQHDEQSNSSQSSSSSTSSTSSSSSSSDSSSSSPNSSSSSSASDSSSSESPSNSSSSSPSSHSSSPRSSNSSGSSNRSWERGESLSSESRADSSRGSVEKDDGAKSKVKLSAEQDDNSDYEVPSRTKHTRVSRRHHRHHSYHSGSMSTNSFGRTSSMGRTALYSQNTTLHAPYRPLQELRSPMLSFHQGPISQGRWSQVYAAGCEDGTLRIVASRLEDGLATGVAGAVGDVFFSGPLPCVRVLESLQGADCIDVVVGGSLGFACAVTCGFSNSSAPDPTTFGEAQFEAENSRLDISPASLLPDSNMHDSVLCCMTADVDFDGREEVIFGTYGQQLLVYGREEEGSALASQDDARAHRKYPQARTSFRKIWEKPFAYPVSSIDGGDFNTDGVDELVVNTFGGIHVLQPNLNVAADKLLLKLESLEQLRALSGQS